MIKTNNNDRQKVLATVAHTVVDSMQHHPDAAIFVQGSTASRTRLYQMGIASIWHEVENEYLIFGSLQGKWHAFAKGVNYDSFLLKRK